ncbi:MAG TPA: PTS sugar transporter subunit IIB [Anaerolineae bacterium]|nr:PTS sugar transporter subunit IIB [Anaerolineae bacterium]
MSNLKTIKVLLLCAGGMSSSLLEASIIKAAEAVGVDIKVSSYFANIVPYWDFEEHFVDVILIAPQVRFMRKSVAKKVEPLGIIVQVIDPQTYGMVDGEKLFQQLYEALKARDASGSLSPT